MGLWSSVFSLRRKLTKAKVQARSLNISNYFQQHQNNYYQNDDVLWSKSTLVWSRKLRRFSQNEFILILFGLLLNQCDLTTFILRLLLKIEPIAMYGDGWFDKIWMGKLKMIILIFNHLRNVNSLIRIILRPRRHPEFKTYFHYYPDEFLYFWVSTMLYKMVAVATSDKRKSLQKQSYLLRY